MPSSEPLKICVLTTSYPRFPGDEASVFVQRTVKAFDDAGLSGVVIIPRDQSEPERELQGAFALFRYRYGLFVRGSLAFGSGIVPNLRRRPYLIFQAFPLLLCMGIAAWRHRKSFSVIHANWIVCGVVAALLRVLIRKPFVVTLRGEDMRLLKSRVVRTVVGASLRRAAFVVSVNDAFLQEAATLLDLQDSQLRCIPNGVALPAPTQQERQRFLQGRPLFAERDILIFVGTITPRKRIELLLELLKGPEGAEFALVVCGRESDLEYAARVKESVKRSGLEERVIFEGAVAPADIPLYLESAKCYVSASEHEGRPNSMLEALSMGLPVLASDIPGHAELVNSGENGFLVPLEDFEKGREHLYELCRGDDLPRYREKARQSVAHLTWEECGRRYREVFVEAASGKAVAASG